MLTYPLCNPPGHDGGKALTLGRDLQGHPHTLKGMVFGICKRGWQTVVAQHTAYIVAPVSSSDSDEEGDSDGSSVDTVMAGPAGGRERVAKNGMQQ